MDLILGVLTSMRNWSVELKMVIMLIFSVVVFPLATLVFLHSQGMQQTTNFIVCFLAGAIILLVPAAKWMSHVVALRSIRELNTQCRLLKEGDYAHVDLSSGDEEGHDFMTLKRNMHWMGYTIATREHRLQKAMTDLASAQRQIGESLDYASLIQTSFLPERTRLAELLPDHFLLWAQRDIVGGDSYWFAPSGDGFFVGVIDCTGHGVPGAFMTLIVHSLLEKAAADSNGSPAVVLGRMNRLIKDALRQNNKHEAVSDDGMDCTLCHINPASGRLLFAGANNPLYVVDSEGARVIKGDRCGLGYVRSHADFVFTDVEIRIDPDARYYMATDGLLDQVGGENRFPFGKRRFLDFVTEFHDRSLMDLERELMRCLTAYQGDEVRRDDMTVLGFEFKQGG